MLPLLRKTLRDHMKPFLWWSFALIATFVVELWAYPTINQSTSEMRKMVEAYPESFQKVFRMQDYFSGAGFLGTEMYSMMVPLVFIAIGAFFGAGATAAEEERGTADVLLALPITRTRLLLGKMLALPIAFLALTAAIVLVLAVGMPIADLDASLVNVTLATMASALLGFLCAGCAYLLGAWTGRRGVALGAAIGVSIVSFVVYGLAPMVAAFDTVIEFVPWQWAMGNDPLRNGADLPHYALLLAVTAVLYAAALWLFRRRDIEA